MNPTATAIRFLKNLVVIARTPFIARKGLRQYRNDGRVSRKVWHHLLAAHCASNGRTTDFLNSITRTVRPPRAPRATDGLLGHFTINRQQEIAAALDQDGFYVFPELMPVEFLDLLQGFAAKAPAVIESNRDLKEPLVPYDRSHPVSRTYKIQEKDSLQNTQIQQLLADPVFVGIAEIYLGALPAIGGMDVWWSARYGNRAGSDAAQLFHFDFDAPPAWLKLFIYVTDVSPEHGPHVYVKGSHKAGLSTTREFRSRGYERISDDEMEMMFGADTLVEISGKRGTVFMADTRGFHKGKFPTGGDRLVAQVIYCSPIYNDHGDPPGMPENPNAAFAEAIKAAPGVYERFTQHHH